MDKFTFRLLEYVLLFTFVFNSAGASCPPKVPTDKVARMCFDNSVSGTNVYIDTTGAQATENSTGPLCECTINLYNAKLVMLNIVGANEICGSELNFIIKSSGTLLKTNANCKRFYKNKIIISNHDSMNLTLHKTNPPFLADYCTRVSLELCSADQYQCDDGLCIPEEVKCDGFPDCDSADDEDENMCAKTICDESQVACSNGKGCYSDSQKCDNITHCGDHSDEQGCEFHDHLITTQSSLETLTEPTIEVICYETTYFTTTTTPTPTTTPTTPMTTTTTPTTTQSTTTTTPTATTKTPLTTTTTNTTPLTTTTTPTATTKTPLTTTTTNTTPLTTAATPTATTKTPTTTTTTNTTPLTTTTTATTKTPLTTTTTNTTPLTTTTLTATTKTPTTTTTTNTTPLTTTTTPTATTKTPLTTITTTTMPTTITPTATTKTPLTTTTTTTMPTTTTPTATTKTPLTTTTTTTKSEKDPVLPNSNRTEQEEENNDDYIEPETSLLQKPWFITVSACGYVTLLATSVWLAVVIRRKMK